MRDWARENEETFRLIKLSDDDWQKVFETPHDWSLESFSNDVSITSLDMELLLKFSATGDNDNVFCAVEQSTVLLSFIL